jgi:hypothetical protein
MIFSKAFSIALLSMVLAGCASSPTQQACANQDNPPVVFRPPLDSVLSVTSQLKPTSYKHFSGVVISPPEYRPYARLWIEVASDGKPVDVRMPVLDGYESSGNRAVDRALFEWAKGMRFSPDNCGTPRYRTASVAVDLPM